MATDQRIDRFPTGSRIAIFPEHTNTTTCIYIEQTQSAYDVGHYLLLCIGKRGEWCVSGFPINSDGYYSIENGEKLLPDDKEQRCMEILRDPSVRHCVADPERASGNIASDKGRINIYDAICFDNDDVPSVIARATQSWKETFPDRDEKWKQEVEKQRVENQKKRRVQLAILAGMVLIVGLYLASPRTADHNSIHRLW